MNVWRCWTSRSFYIYVYTLARWEGSGSGGWGVSLSFWSWLHNDSGEVLRDVRRHSELQQRESWNSIFHLLSGCENRKWWKSDTSWTVDEYRSVWYVKWKVFFIICIGFEGVFCGAVGTWSIVYCNCWQKGVSSSGLICTVRVYWQVVSVAHSIT